MRRSSSHRCDRMTVAGMSLRSVTLIVAMQQNRGACMLVTFDRMHEPEIAERSVGDWRGVASAWFVALAFAALFSGWQTLAAHHQNPFHQSSLAGAIIPRHNSSVPGPDEIAASDWLERVRAEAYGL